MIIVDIIALMLPNVQTSSFGIVEVSGSTTGIVPVWDMITWNFMGSQPTTYAKS